MSSTNTVEVKPSPLGGKGTFTTRACEAGDVVFSLDRPLIATLDRARIADTCSWCFSWTDLPGLSGAGINQTAKVNWCSGCKKVKYCSKRCQSQSWKAIHKRECKELASQAEPLPNTVFAVIQMMEGLSVGDQRYSAILELDAHRDDFEKAGGQRWDSMQLMATTAMSVMRAKGVNVAGESATMSMCVLMCNSSRLVTPTFDPLGLVLDPAIARLNHSCDPNAVMVFDGPRLAARALAPIREGDEVLISYIDNTAPYGVRQGELQSQYFFDCKCTKCQLGNKAAQDAFLDPTSDFEERIKLIDDLLPKLVDDPAWPRHVLGESKHEQRLSALQFYAYSYLDSPDAARPTRDAASLRKAIAIIRNTGVWPLSRQPLPALYRQYAIACLEGKRYNEAFIAMLRLHALIDPVVYPQAHHPVRVVHAWSLATLSKAIGSDPTSEFCRALQSQGVDLSMLFLALLFEVVEQVEKSHGSKSLFGQTVGGALQAMMEPGGELDSQFSLMGVSREQWPKIVEDRIKELWPKVLAFAENDDIAAQIDEAVA